MQRLKMRFDNMINGWFLMALHDFVKQGGVDLQQ